MSNKLLASLTDKTEEIKLQALSFYNAVEVFNASPTLESSSIIHKSLLDLSESIGSTFKLLRQHRTLITANLLQNKQ